MSTSRIVSLSLLFLFLISSLVPLALAQTQIQTAQKFDEFGDIQVSEIKARLDNFAIQLQHTPLSKGFILVYRSRRDLPGLSYRYAHRMEDYLVSTRALEQERVVAVDGGEADCLRQELWIVPPGTAPTPRSDAYQRHFADTDFAREFDEVSWGSEEAATAAVYEGEFEAYAAALSAEPHALAYLVAYPGYYVDRVSEGGNRKKPYSVVYRDPPGTVRRILAQGRRLLVKNYHISPSRIRVMNGGYRRWGSLELWIVPRGEHAPIPTPNSFPRFRNHLDKK